MYKQLLVIVLATAVACMSAEDVDEGGRVKRGIAGYSGFTGDGSYSGSGGYGDAYGAGINHHEVSGAAEAIAHSVIINVFEALHAAKRKATNTGAQVAEAIRVGQAATEAAHANWIVTQHQIRPIKLATNGQTVVATKAAYLATSAANARAAAAERAAYETQVAALTKTGDALRHTAAVSAKLSYAPKYQYY